MSKNNVPAKYAGLFSLKINIFGTKLLDMKKIGHAKRLCTYKDFTK